MTLWNNMSVKTKRHKRQAAMSFNGLFEKRVVLNGQFSPWIKMNTGIPQGIKGYYLA